MLARASVAAGCGHHVLLLDSDQGLADGENTAAFNQRSALLLSDRTGLPIVAWHEVAVGAALTAPLAQALFAKSEVHLLACMPEAALVNEWHSTGHCWAACVKANLRVAAADGSFEGTLGKLAGTLIFSQAQAIALRGKAALVSVADVIVSLRPDVNSGTCASEAPLRCVIRRVVEAGSGRLMALSYLVASAGVHATAQQMSQWAAWRTAAEPHFRLLAQADAQLLVGGAPSGEQADLKRVLVAGQFCSTVLRLQQASEPWAEVARKVLTQLAGCAVRPGRLVSGPVLLEGLIKFLLLLEALETDAGSDLQSRSQA